MHQAPSTGYSQHIAQRLGPRRQFAFDALVSDEHRRLADMLMADRGGLPWQLPIWPDQQRVGALLEDDTFIACTTDGFDFHAGGLALLWKSPTQWGVVTIDVVDVDGLQLAAGLSADWQAGAYLYPLRRALLSARSNFLHITDTVAKPKLQFAVDEPCDWPSVMPSQTYLGHSVAEVLHDEAGDDAVSYDRILTSQDNGTSLPAVHDTACVTLRAAPHAWELWGRAQQGAFRSLIYALDGRQVPVWVPSWAQDLKLTATVSAAATSLTVEWCGYTVFGRQQANRRDIRIELYGGTVLYRRITSSAEAGANETLGLSSALGQEVTPQSVRRISFMALSTQGSDEIEIHHYADSNGRARAVTAWKAVVPDV